MSGLAALLAGRTPTGVYHWDPAFAVADVRHTVEHAGWSFAHLDGVGVETKAGVMAALKQAFDLPEHFGANYDALWDSLRDLDEPMLLLWDSWGPLAHADEFAFTAVCELLEERADQGGFAVLLRGAGPGTGLPALD